MFTVRRAASADAAALVSVFQSIAAERIYSAIDKAWTLAEQQRYLERQSSREAVLVATDRDERVIGCQTLDLYSSSLSTMAHVGQIGTFIAPDWRGRGVGRGLFEAMHRIALANGFRKLVITVRASNAPGLAFYARLGFVECGRLAAQVTIDGHDDDEVLMERFLR